MRGRWTVVALICAGILISYIDRGNLGLAAPFMMSDFHLSPALMGVLLSAFFWTYGAFQIPAGILVDRFGIRWVYAGAFLLWSLATAGIGLNRGFVDVLVLRLLLGIAEAVGPVASLSFIRRHFSATEIGLPTAIYIAGQNLGPAVGTLLGTHLIDQFGWRFMFMATGLAALAWLPGWLLLAPRSGGAQKTTAAVPLREIAWREAFAAKAFWAMPLCIFFSSYFWYFLLIWVPTYLTTSRGFSTLERGRALSIPLFVMAILNVGAGWAADRLARRLNSEFRVRLWFCAGGYIAAGSLLLLPWLEGHAAILTVMLIAVCGVGIGNSNYWALAQRVPPSTLVGRATGYLNTISQVAGAAAPLITGWILGPQNQFTLALAIAAISPLIAAGCLLSAGTRGLEKMKRLLAVNSPA